MKKILCIVLAVMLLLLAGCAAETAPDASAEEQVDMPETEQQEEAKPDDLPPENEPVVAVDGSLVNVFGMPGDEALAELGLQDAPYDEDMGGMVAEYEWCGEKLQTVVNPDWTGTGEVISVRAQTERSGGETAALADYVKCFTAQFGAPLNYSKETSGEGRFGYTYDEAALESIITEFVKLDANSALTFRFALPGRAEEDLEFAECAFYKTEGNDTVNISLHLLRISEPDYEVEEN